MSASVAATVVLFSRVVNDLVKVPLANRFDVAI
jgi:hypothetical protein